MSAAAEAGSACDFETVSVDSVSKYYGRRRALGAVTLECRAGKVTGLFGPNGAGKSTLLGVLSTRMAPASGAVRYGPREATEWGDPLRGRIGVLGHDLFLYSELTARENLRFFGRLYGLDGRHLDSRVDDALAHAALSARADDKVGGFSRGMRQRLAVERALIHDPRLVLLDEPFTGLDDDSVRRLSRRLSDVKRRGAIVMMSTHDLELAESLIDEAVCLRVGRLVSLDGPGTLRARYRAVIGAGD